MTPTKNQRQLVQELETRMINMFQHDLKDYDVTDIMHACAAVLGHTIRAIEQTSNGYFDRYALFKQFVHIAADAACVNILHAEVTGDSSGEAPLDTDSTTLH